MVPYTTDRYERLRMLSDAIKGVYASVFYRASKAYMSATSNVIDQEKMAVIIQEVVGEDHDGYYFPSFSGVGRSLNYYPLGDERPEDGVVNLAVGLGKYIVDGGRGLRFSPMHPEHVLQTSTLDLALRDTQTAFYALQQVSSDSECKVSVNEDYNIVKRPIQDLANTGALRLMVSTYDHFDQVLRDYEEGRGRRVVTFNNILRDHAFPMDTAIDFMLKQGQMAMQRPIEIEFAGMINSPQSDTLGHIYWLQIRPIIDHKELVSDNAVDIDDSRLIMKSNTALGHGNFDNISKIVYVKPETFNSRRNYETVDILNKLNEKYVAANEPYILVGPGRWGSSDSALGIPVRWPDISGARIIVETTLGNYRVEPSQGTHFFQNLTSFGVGYFTVNPFSGDGFCDFDYLNSLEAEYEDEIVRVVRFDKALSVAINGRRGIGIVERPDSKDNNELTE
jgi:hypothetical protein